jgi:hypothetical protein
LTSAPSWLLFFVVFPVWQKGSAFAVADQALHLVPVGGGIVISLLMAAIGAFYEKVRVTIVLLHCCEKLHAII